MVELQFSTSINSYHQISTMLTRIVHVDTTSQAWAPHPTLPGIGTRYTAHPSPELPIADLMVARVDAGQDVPWHVHDTNFELAHILEGEGQALESLAADRGVSHALDVRAGSTLLVPAGVWHAVRNTGEGALIIFIVHIHDTKVGTQEEHGDRR
jgi:quercetin dioxygenase-like cupin family protein